MKKDIELLAETISAIQYIQILLLRTDPDKYPPCHERQITNKELWNIILGVVPPMIELSEDLQKLVISTREEKYGIV